jgi:uncharacterized RDD family membrane protein YckC
VTQPPEEPGPAPADRPQAPGPGDEQPTSPWYQGTTGPPTGPQPQPGYGSPAQPDHGAGAQPTPGQPGYNQAGYAEPGYAQPPSQPGYAQPDYTQPPGQPGYAQPTPGQPGYNQPGYNQPGYSQAPGQPGYAQATYSPPAGQSGYGQPGYAQPGYGQPASYGSPYQPYPGTGYGYRTTDPSLAEWWQRLLARIIDGLVLSVLIIPLWVPVFTSLVNKLRSINNQYAGNTNSQAAQAAISHVTGQFFIEIFLVVIAGLAIALAYDWVQHGLWGRTLGKRALGTMVVTASTRSKISPGAAGGRAAIYVLPSLVPFVGGLFALLNELWLLWDQQRQCLHDKAAQTVVIKVRGPGAPPYSQPAGY